MSFRHFIAPALLAVVALAGCQPVDASEPTPAPPGPTPEPPALMSAVLDPTPQLAPGGPVLPLGSITGGVR